MNDKIRIIRIIKAYNIRRMGGKLWEHNWRVKIVQA